MATLQQQGVPIPNRLRGPQAKGPSYEGRHRKGYTGRHRAPIQDSDSSESAGTGEDTGNTDRGGSSGSKSISRYSPTRVADKVTSGVGLLEAEFLASLVLLVLLMFANTSETYANKIMSIM